MLVVGADKAKPDWKVVRDYLLKEGSISKEHLFQLTKSSIDVMSKHSY
jgi:hypothetical protein